MVPPQKKAKKKKVNICFLNIYFIGTFPKFPCAESHKLRQEEGLQRPIKFLSVIHGHLVSFTISFSCKAW